MAYRTYGRRTYRGPRNFPTGYCLNFKSVTAEEYFGVVSKATPAARQTPPLPISPQNSTDAGQSAPPAARSPERPGPAT